MSTQLAGRIVGGLFLAAFVVYITGGALVDSVAGADGALTRVADHPGRVAAGALLMALNCAIVLTIGVLALPVLRPHGEVSAHAYLAGRVVEAVLLAVGVLFLLLLIPLSREHGQAGADAGVVLSSLGRVAVEANRYSYQLAMVTVAVAGVVFCRTLRRARLVPRPLATWGAAGYAIFAVGAVLEVAGYRVGLVLAVPGGLFEVVFGLFVLVRGFPAARLPQPSAPAVVAG
ncbi:DUF4386 domain-containing protein [Actinoplanes sp. NEAU-A12]|uniref:DUF4386 domain-containing protein n=1 Tax=Actinoplanes sandaracinus TaxID=3045177 RepID=A0ABT6WUD9_9ACTN|nr:DUF4386 domain-containing protein [Actinoplanes sandaracinus]MDI6103362.1 DUF4386 domain-containing protein [Actinoplanes sandaracinus]